ncbi:hypothetical protein GIB67_010011 [Kingdonia uniflora]|uniref:WD repeat-containing protein 75 second beta-propeller domain-containing protein n=1 Tax=Kingdonia uniflora TaxID=39325 RepID=A0A7J7KV68_9MAGN|nr:hypothetical protein GIB67_010011 [Kingdonia uniflora]
MGGWNLSGDGDGISSPAPLPSLKYMVRNGSFRAMLTGGKSFVSSPPAFSSDGKRLLVCTGNTVSVFCTKTGIQITELKGHTTSVTSVIVVPSSTPASKVLCYCWTSSLDGTICYWDFSLPELVRKVDVHLPVFSMIIPNVLGIAVEGKKKQPNLFAFISVKDTTRPDVLNKALHGKILKCNLTKSSQAGGVLSETRHPEFITGSISGEYFGIRNKRKIHVWKINANGSKYDVKKIKLHHTKNLSVLAFHPTQRIIAAGDVTGRILIWRGFGNKSFSENGGPVNGKAVKIEEERAGVRGDDDAESCSTWHWHPAEVKVLFFSSDGAYLYSGGKEGVLVVWQLDTGNKKFLPRIGAPLLYFVDSPDPTLCSISCADNQIHLLKTSSMEILKSISGIKLPCSLPAINDGLRCGFFFDCAAGLVAIPTEAYSVQFYSLLEDREVSQVQICERNHQAPDDVTIVVTLLALSEDGLKLSTVDTKLSEEGIGGLVCLKFWDYGSRRGQFTLSTIIYEPHSDARISAIAFHPICDMVVSSSYSGDFKIWVRSVNMQQKDRESSKPGWRCHSVGSYKRKSMTAAAFSADGSVLAVAAETVITLWDPEQNVFVAVIGETTSCIETLSFVGKSEYLLAVSRGSKAQLSVWSMSKLSISWSYQLLAEAVTCSRDGSRFAVLVLLPESGRRMNRSEKTTIQVGDGVIVLFNVEDPVPVATWSVKKAKGGGISFLQADPSLIDENFSDEKSPSEMLVYLSGDHEYILFDPYSKEDSTISWNCRKSRAPLEETGNSGYAAIYAELPEIPSERHQIESAPYLPSEKPWETIFSGSSHVLPPLTKLCSVFLESLLEKLPTAQD